ncbi:PhoX family protein [Bordetella genomosp. 13]|uniref:Alkaline phosphatase n=1 Tax=Bordetella genomosp. 13 TaxID=463040 RepID=A0A1W6ZD88_9BORD|nr:alkaline phosphatase PhoX [Bordetella genomosp. 13]ARP95343.1 alkaline phosphatase [Bordetella genomosp. 13]
MPDTTSASRRRALKLLAGAPLLPIGAFGVTQPALAARADGATFLSARFVSMDAPTLADPAEMAATTVKSALEVTYSDGSKQTYRLGYEPFFVTGDMVPDGKGGTILAGGYYDIHNRPIIDTSGSAPRQFYSDCPDGSSLIRLPRASVPGVQGNTVFAVVQFEYASRNLRGDEMYGRLPSPIAVLTLDQDPDTGALKLVKYHNVDTSSVQGLWITCGASLSPWNTHLASEEYEPDAATPASAQMKAFSASLYGAADRMANPYDYGHLPEVVVHPDGTGSIRKHYCLGRISHELIQVMPDQRTALMGDDATNGGLFMFVADRAADLSAGTLYVARWNQTSAEGAGAGTLQWIRLGHAASDEIRAMAARLTIGDILDLLTEDPADDTYKFIHCNGKPNWIRVKPGMEKAAAFLETHRYAAYVGGSMALSKNEGTTVNARDRIAYSALANVVDSMVKGGKGWYEGSGIALDKKLQAGAILAHRLEGGQKDTSGQPIPSEWVPTESSTLLTGRDIAADALGNTAHPDHIASPDNLKFSEKLRTLFIGEDSGNHVNNFLWAYHVDTRELSRVLSCPAGAESTGLHAVDEINGWTYIMSNFQHAGDWSKLHAQVRDKLDPLVKHNYKDGYGASVGYITGVDLRIGLMRT